jgi:nucleotide-binding universal stress UspA family protein
MTGRPQETIMNTTIHHSAGAGAEIVVGVDGTSTALRAVQWAAAEAHLRGIGLQILHAAPYATGPSPDPGRQRAEEILARAYTVAHRAEPEVPARTHAVAEQPVPALLSASAQAELLVVGMGGRDRSADLVIGSTALAVSGQAHCPVIIARGRRHPRDTDRPVLVGVDSVESNTAALNFAFADARRHGGPIVVLHARHGAEQIHDRLAGTETLARYLDISELAKALTPWTRAYPDVPVKLDVVVGHPSATLLGAAAHASLVVVGSRGRSAPARALFGSTSRELLRRCPTPVAVLPVAVTADPVPAPADPGRGTPTGTGLDHPHDLSRLW